ncbi:MAG: tetratricopeptide repeat protein [Planctomycetota bacterium]
MVKPEHDAIEMAGIRFQIGIFEEALERNPHDAESLRFLAHAYGQMERFEDRLAADQKLVELAPQDPRAHYNLACSFALAGRTDDAIEALEHACLLGFRDAVLLRKDHELDALREDPRFLAIAARIEDG